MAIIIVGAGFTGVQLAKRLIANQKDVVLIDNDEEKIRHLSNRLDCMVMLATGNNLETLEDAGIAKAHALITLTESDELNMIICSLVDSMYPTVMKIARVRNYDYYCAKKHTNNERPLYGIDCMVHPDEEAAKSIVKAMEHGAVTEVMDFEDSETALISMKILKKSQFDGIFVREMRCCINVPFMLAYTEKEETVSLPSGSSKLSAGTRIGIVSSKDNIPALLECCGTTVHELKRIALVGAGRIGTKIAERITSQQNVSSISRFFGVHKKLNQDFLIIEPDKRRAKEASEKFLGATVHRADITDDNFIEEENLGTYDLVITATRNHERNMVTAAYLKTLGVRKTICLVQSFSYGIIARNIGIDVAVPIKDAVVDTILSHLRGKSVTDVHSIFEGELEIVQLTIDNNSEAVGKKLRDFKIGTFLILLIEKTSSNEFVIPKAETVFEGGDKLVIIVDRRKNDKQNLKNLAQFGVREP
ncbi:MAG TPA: NAD-binding protein [Treponemataceae bacterium]|nr:NAD-binding protein [Treponemataceae bacterium]